MSLTVINRKLVTHRHRKSQLGNLASKIRVIEKRLQSAHRALKHAKTSITIQRTVSDTQKLLGILTLHLNHEMSSADSAITDLLDAKSFIKNNKIPSR